MNIKIDSRKVKEGDTFIAIREINNDGHKYVIDAINNGATTVIVEEGEYSVNTIVVNDTKKSQASMVNGHIESDISTDDITYNVDDLDDIGNIKAVGQISEKIIQDIKHQAQGTGQSWLCNGYGHLYRVVFWGKLVDPNGIYKSVVNGRISILCML